MRMRPGTARRRRQHFEERFYAEVRTRLVATFREDRCKVYIGRRGKLLSELLADFGSPDAPAS